MTEHRPAGKGLYDQTESGHLARSGLRFIVERFAESIRASLVCNDPRCEEHEWALGLRPHQIRVLEGILTNIVKGLSIGYIQAIPGSGISAIEVLIPSLLNFAGLGHGLSVIVTPRLLTVREIAEEATRISLNTSVHYCLGWRGCEDTIGNLIKTAKKEGTHLLIITYQMLVSLYKKNIALLARLAYSSRAIIFDYPDVNGIGSTLAKAIEYVRDSDPGAMFAFLAWENRKIEKLFLKEISRIRMKEVTNLYARTVFVKEDKRENRPARVARIVDKYLRALRKGNLPIYSTALLVTYSSNRAEDIAESLEQLGYDTVVVNSDRPRTRVMVEEAKSKRRVVIEAGSLAAGYNHKDVDILFLDAQLGMSRYAVYRGIVTRKRNTVSRLKSSHSVALIVDLTGKNAKREEEFCRKHKLRRKIIKAPNVVEGVLSAIRNGRIHSIIVIRDRIKPKKARIRECSGLNDAIRKVILSGEVAMVCKSLAIVREGTRIVIYSVSGDGGFEKKGEVGFGSFEQMLQEIRRFAEKHCYCRDL